MSDLSFLSRLPEALERYDYQVANGLVTAADPAVFAAARLVSEWVSPCPNCEGTDEVGADGKKSHVRNTAVGPCPHCHRGLVLSEQAIDRVEKALPDFIAGPGRNRIYASDVLWAVLDGEGE